MQKSHTLCLIFAVIDEFCKHLKIPARRGGPHPTFTTNKLLKLIMLRSLLGITSERSFIRLMGNLKVTTFPRIPSHSWLNRRTKELTPVLNRFRVYLLSQIPEASDILRIVDSTPVPVVRYRRGEGKLAQTLEDADFGYCAAHQEKYFGYKLHLLTSSQGIPLHFDITKASLPDVKMLEELLEAVDSGIVLADKGYQSFDLKRNLLADNKLVITPNKKNQKHNRNTQAETKLLTKRQRIEAVIHQLKDIFGLAKLQARSLSGFVARIMSIMTTMTLAVFTNRRLGRRYFQIKTLIT